MTNDLNCFLMSREGALQQEKNSCQFSIFSADQLQKAELKRKNLKIKLEKILTSVVVL